MDFRAIWYKITGACRALVGYLGEMGIGERLASGLDYVRRSFVALVSSKAVWASVIVVGLGAWSAGYLAAAGGKRALRSEVAGLKIKLEQVMAAEQLARQNEQRQMAAHVVTMNRFEAEQAEVERLKRLLEARSASVAAVSRSRASKAPQSQPAVGEAPAKWVPWQ